MSIKQHFLCLMFLTFLIPSVTQGKQPFIVLLDPGTQNSSDLQKETVRCLEALGRMLEDKFPTLHVVIAQESGTIDPVQKGSFSNRIKATVHIIFNFYLEKESQNILHVYTCGNPSCTFFEEKNLTKTFIPTTDAYQGNQKQSYSYAKQFVATIKGVTPAITIFEPISLPLKQLQPLSAPAFLVELTIPVPDAWKTVFPYLCQGLVELISMENLDHAV